jgi:hypothetical protein
MDADVIRDIKVAAVGLDKSASQVLEEAAREWLERHHARKTARAAATSFRVVQTISRSSDALTVSRRQMLRAAGKGPILVLKHSSRRSRLRGEEYGDRWRTRRKIST